jgi:hypothetical protein
MYRYISRLNYVFGNSASVLDWKSTIVAVIFVPLFKLLKKLKDVKKR